MHPISLEAMAARPVRCFAYRPATGHRALPPPVRLAPDNRGAALMTGGLRAVTGFNFNALAEVPLTPPPSPAELVPRLGPVCDRMPKTRPEFRARLSGRFGLAQTAAE